MKTTAADAIPAALHQGPIDWQAWSEQAFRRASAEDKLVLVDVGAVWCHWCHVMDRTTYDHPEVAKLIGEKFVPIRVDRDQRPDIDSRLQRAVPVIRSAGNGWPLTVVMTPAGQVLYKATYLPPTADPRTGFGLGFGLVDLLDQLDKVYRQRRDELHQVGQELAAQMSEGASQGEGRPAEVSNATISQAVTGLREQFDREFGGFGGGEGPKFPHPAAANLGLRLGERNKDDGLRRMAGDTLTAMARGGLHDHLAGGFHRYSVDRYWRVPHFEKMASDNAGLLINYARAYAATGQSNFRQAAEGILRFTADVLYDQEAGGFYGSQDADIGLHDDGDYFTWTLQEVQAALAGSAEELEAATRWFDISEIGDMRESPGRNVLHTAKTIEQLAKLMQLDPTELERRIDSAKAKLLAARRHRPTPWVDKTIFADWNGGYIRACGEAYKLLGLPEAEVGRVLDLATRAADRLLRQGLGRDGQLQHYLLPDGPGTGPPAPAAVAAAGGATAAPDCPVVGQLSDHAYLAWGLLGLYSITGRSEHLDAAVRLLDHILDRLTDRADGGFFDQPGPPDGTALLQGRHKQWEDSPGQSPESIACLALLEAWQYTGREEFAEAARKALAGFAGSVQPQIGLFVAGWALAADVLLHPPTHVLIVGRAEGLGPMLRSAWSASPLGEVLTEPLELGDPLVGQRLRRMGIEPEIAGSGSSGAANRPGGAASAVAYVCVGGSCLAPVNSPPELEGVLVRNR